MAELVYLLCLLMSTGCAVALFRTYVRRRSRVLLWSALCFVGLALNNGLLFVDLVLYPDIDLAMPRAILGSLAMLTLVVGLVWDVE